MKLCKNCRREIGSKEAYRVEAVSKAMRDTASPEHVWVPDGPETYAHRICPPWKKYERPDNWDVELRLRAAAYFGVHHSKIVDEKDYPLDWKLPEVQKVRCDRNHVFPYPFPVMEGHCILCAPALVQLRLTFPEDKPGPMKFEAGKECRQCGYVKRRDKFKVMVDGKERLSEVCPRCAVRGKKKTGKVRRAFLEQMKATR